MRWAMVVVAIVAGLAVGTIAALEGGEVVVLRTGSDTDPRETRTWIAEADGAWWIEAANESRAFFRDVGANGRVGVRRGDRWHRCNATIVPEPGGHDRIRRLLRDRYGWRDRWIGCIADTHASRAIRLECETP